MARAPDPSNLPTLSERNFNLELQRIEEDLHAMETRGESVSVMVAYLKSARAKFMAKIATKELKIFEQYFQQRESTLKAVMGAYDAEERFKQLKERTKLQHEKEMAELKSEHERAIQDQRSTAESEQLKHATELTQLRAELVAANAHEKAAQELADLEILKERLKAQASVQELQKPQDSTKKEPQKSPEERLVARLSNLIQIEEDLKTQGLSEPDRKRIIEEARRAILVEHRLGKT